MSLQDSLPPQNEMSWFRDFPRKRILGMIAEQFVPDGLCVKLYNYKENHWDHLMNWQHVTMCLFYSISGLVDIVAHGTDAFPVAIGRMIATLDLHVHQLLLGAIFGVSICIFLEVFFHGSIVTIRLRTSLCILQGSWLWQIVFVLYPPNGIPEGNQMDHNNMLFLTMCCCWHYAFAFLILAVNYTVVSWGIHSVSGPDWLCKISPGASFQISKQKALKQLQSETRELKTFRKFQNFSSFKAGVAWLATKQKLRRGRGKSGEGLL
uniref:Transmembrane protein 45B n=1 Tax=Crocodylus porosus TaxID=8502 RepID=A0A7M4E3T4_CROPO